MSSNRERQAGLVLAGGLVLVLLSKRGGTAPPPPPPTNGNGGNGNGTEPEITESNLPWGATIQNLGLGSGFSLNIWIENNDIRFHLTDTGVPEGEDHFYLVRTFDPQGLHVKDWVAQMSDTLRQRIDPIAARIQNVAGTCAACNYQPGTWTFYIMGSPNVRFTEDTSRPLKYGPYTAVTEGMTVQLMDDMRLSV